MAGFYPEDPLAPEQWHLQRLGNLARIWAEFTGAGIHVGVYDDGVQHTHHDLDGNYDATLHVVVGGTTFDGANLLGIDGHGTAVAGLIAAEANGEGTVGIAFGASVTGVNIFDGGSALFINAASPQGFFDAVGQSGLFDVVNHSWGGTPGFEVSQSLDVVGNFTTSTLAGWVEGAANGRDGLGTVVVKSAGNDSRDAQGEGLNASRFSITVSAIGDSGFAASYSNHGASVLVGAPGNEFPENGGLGIVTTDLLGTDGYNLVANGGADSDVTDRFGGTSAAAPIVTAVVALMLDANAGLGWRDVQNILAASATHTGSAFSAASLAGTFEDAFWNINKADNWNGGGMHTHANYGHGAVNAYNAVRMAEVWTLFAPAQTSANEQVVTTGTVVSGEAIPDLGTVDVTMSLAAALEIEHIALTVTFTHANMIDLDLYLTSAEGTVVRLLDGSAGAVGIAATSLTWTFGIDVLRGENLAGTWTVTFDDVVADAAGTVTAVSLAAYGRAIPVDDVFHFTDEFATMAALYGQAGRRSLTDTDGGTDWINAAAVTTGSVINLRQNAYSSIAGGFTRITGDGVIENAIGGDGDDLLIGNAADNELRGMRGVDTLRGGAGNDLYVVDHAADVVTEAAGGGSDTIHTSVGYTLGASAEVEVLEAADSLGGGGLDLTGNAHGQVIRGNAAGNKLQGLAGADALHGLGGDDVLSGGTENDTLFGGEGNDALDGGAGADSLDGGAGNDRLRGNEGNDTLIGGFGDDTIEGGAGADSMVGGDGEDGVSYASATARIVADLARGGSDGDAAGDTYLGIERVTGSAFNDIVRGDAAANRIDGGDGNDQLLGRGGVDRLIGGAGNDRLVGGEGADKLEGMSGNDTFVWDAVSESPPTGHDVIRDWNLGDLLDLSGIDADVALAGNQAFTFLGTTATPTLASAGQIFVFQLGGSTFASGGIDDDGLRDLLIELTGLHALTSASFIL